MNSFWKSALLAGAAWSTLTAAAWAQDTAPAAETEVGEIVVTARRTEENLQSVPGAVSAFSERTLERLQAFDVTGLQGAVPNMNLSQGRGSGNSTNIFIRGIGQPDALQTFDPAIGVYVDDVYYSRIRGTQFDLFDLERIEVLRGPQGTLYGKNTIGGALKVVTRKPNQTYRANASLALGSYNQFEVKGGVSGPVTDTLAVGVSALLSKRDGYVEDPVLDREYNDKDTQAIRAQLAWTPTDDVRVDFSADYSRDDAAMTVGQATSTLTTLFGVPLKVLPAQPPEYDFKTRTSPDLPNSTKLDHYGFAGTVSWNLTEALTLKSITAYRNLKTRDYVDIDATELELGDVYVGVDQDQTSQEFQLAYEEGRWTVIGGLYWLQENIVSHQEAYGDDVLGTLPNPFPVGPAINKATFLRTVDDDLETTSKAAYVNVSFDLTETLQLTGGLRYTEEEKTYSRTTSTFSNNPTFTANPAFAFSGLNETWNDTSPMLDLRWQAADNIMLYVRGSKGFKSGGFNGRANNPGEQAAYQPEEATSYEAGVKSTFSEGRYLINFTVFTNDYKDFQARVSGLVVDPITGLPSPELTVINAGSMTTEGAELEVVAKPIPGLLLDAQAGLLNAEYDEFEDARFPGRDRSFQQPAFTPKWTVRYGAQYEWNLGEAGYLTVGGQAKYRSEMALAVDNTLGTTHTRAPGMWDGDHWLFDARVVWENSDRRYSAGIYGQNLSDEVYKSDAQEFSSVSNIRTAYYGAPQTFTLRVTAKY